MARGVVVVVSLVSSPSRSVYLSLSMYEFVCPSLSLFSTPSSSFSQSIFLQLAVELVSLSANRRVPREGERTVSSLNPRPDSD